MSELPGIDVPGVDLHVFASLGDLVECTDGPETGSMGRYSREMGNEGFFGTSSWEEAKRIALAGYDDARPMVDELVPSVLEGLDPVEETQMLPLWDVSGGSVDIGRFVAGEPECMVDFSMQNVPADRLVRIVVAGNAPWFVRKGEMMKRGAVIVALVEALSLAKYSVELWVEVAINPSNGRSKTPLVTLCRIKAAEEPLDINAFMFSVAHASYLRRVVFGSWETLSMPHRKRYGAYPAGGYGHHDISRVLCSDALDAHIAVPMIERGDQIVSHPAEWLRDQVRRIQNEGVLTA